MLRTFPWAFVCVLNAILPCATAAQPPSPPKTPAIPAANDVAASGYIIEQQHTRLRFEADGTSRREVSARIRVLNEPAVRQWGQIPLTYASETEEVALKDFQVQKPDGTIAATGPGAVQDLAIQPFEHAQMFLDIRRKLITVPALRPGDVLAFTVVWTSTRPIVRGHFWHEYSFTDDVVVNDERLEIDVPAGVHHILRTRAGSAAEKNAAAPEESAGRRLYRWQSSNARPQTSDDRTALLDDEAPRADIRLTTFKDWMEVAEWFRSLMNTPVDPSVRTKAAELIQEISDPATRGERIYDYVSSEIRYVSLSFGLGRFAPHPPGEVLKHQFGDCKDKAALLASLFRPAGLEALPVLLHSQRSIEEDFASPLEIDHVISVMPNGSEPSRWMWMDTTLEVAPPGMLPAHLRGKRVLVVGEGTAMTRLVRTPADPPFPSIDRIDVDAAVNEIGVLTGTVKFTLRGDTELVARTFLRTLPESERKSFAEGVAISQGFQGEVSEVTISDPVRTRDPFELTFRLRRSGYLNWADSASELTLFPKLSFPMATAEQRKNRKKIEFGSPRTVDVRLRLKLPQGYTMQAPVPVASTLAGFEYSSTYSVEGGALVVSRTLRRPGREISGERFGEYAALIAAVEADLGQVVRVRGNATAVSAIPSDATTTELYAAALSAYNARNYEAAVTLWARTTELDPKMGDAWLSLGLAYDELGKYAEASAAIQKQIDLDPFNKRAYGDLASVQSNAGNLEGAVKSYARHVELNPLDGHALKELGESRFKLRQYAEALPSLERAAALVTTDAWLHTILGSTYLHVGRVDKARAAFERAVELSPRPDVLTKIGWQMAERGVELDRAWEHVSNSAKQIAEKTASLDLETVDDDQLHLLETLAWSWDALGWIAFQKGRVADAERYVRAAYSMLGHTDIALHLGRIYEKLDRSADATSFYLTAQALSDRPAPEALDHVRRMLGGDAPPSLLEGARRVAIERRLSKLSARAPESLGTFLVLVGSDRRAVDVQFVNGSDRVRALGVELRKIEFPLHFPDAAPLRIVLTVVVRCNAPEPCVAMSRTIDQVELSR